MTTATETTKPDDATATQRERELELALTATQAEVTATNQRAYEYRKRIEELKGSLLERATTHPGEFSETGIPKPKTPTAKIDAEVKKLVNADSFAALITGAEAQAIHRSTASCAAGSNSTSKVAGGLGAVATQRLLGSRHSGPRLRGGDPRSPRCEGGPERVRGRLTAQLGPSWPSGRN